MKNLKDYILHLDNWIPKNILDKTLKELSKDKTWQRHTFTNPRTFESSITYHDRFPEIHRGNQVKNENLYPNPNSMSSLGNKMKDVFLIEETLNKKEIL